MRIPSSLRRAAIHATHYDLMQTNKLTQASNMCGCLASASRSVRGLDSAWRDKGSTRGESRSNECLEKGEGGMSAGLEAEAAGY